MNLAQNMGAANMLLYEVLPGTVSTGRVKDNVMSHCLRGGGIRTEEEGVDKELGSKRVPWTTSCGEELIALTRIIALTSPHSEAKTGVNMDNNANVNLASQRRGGSQAFQPH